MISVSMSRACYRCGNWIYRWSRSRQLSSAERGMYRGCGGRSWGAGSCALCCWRRRSAPDTAPHWLCPSGVYLHGNKKVLHPVSIAGCRDGILTAD